MLIILRLIRESYIFAIQSLIANKLRTILSLLGITIGIFAIIFVLTTVDSMERTIRESMQSLGKSTIFIQKWPWGYGGEYHWWEYVNRPMVSYEEMQELQDRVRGDEAMAFMASTSKTVEYRDKNISNITIMGVSYEYNQLESINIREGRYFTPSESSLGSNMAILGHDVADKLFPGTSAIGKSIKIFGRKLTVIGYIEKMGMDNFGMSTDKQVLVPVMYLRSIMDLRNNSMNQSIMTRPAEGVDAAMFKGELKAAMRNMRSIRPDEKDNFAINEVDVASKNLASLFSTISVVGWFIGGISIFIGGFGIANIMFVSVKERTKIIGIQKALGSKNYFILLQFLFEAIILSVIGGLVGLFFVWLTTLLLADIQFANIEFKLYLDQSNIILGLTVSIIVGIFSGIIPAIQASRMNPVEAIRTGN
ncbi:MAG: ABC transporter permease [Bacteroidales bacterium]|nr:ABC transporter permease [Bacteroidales bacterium]MCF8327011.1 ABC transporter permease [Bacteroidales bacterium]